MIGKEHQWLPLGTGLLACLLLVIPLLVLHTLTCSRARLVGGLDPCSYIRQRMFISLHKPPGLRCHSW